ncbi:MAG: 50S ribosomal protein L18 [Anaerolineales bacterium]|nr:MAG: 50S ribosomal protein L18 [Anaerolineales bacterium]
MMAKESRNKKRTRRHGRVRKKVSGTAERPRLNVFRSLNQIYAQVIDDERGHTITTVSTLEQAIQSKLKGLNKTEQAALVGQELAKKAKKEGIKVVVFDRGGFRYHGRIKALAEAAREAGLEF